MSPITHALTSWVLAERTLKDNRDVLRVTIAGIAPDIDSIGVIADLLNGWLDRPPTDYYASLHHWLLHGAAGAVLVAMLVTIRAKERLKVFVMSLLVFHIHLLCDILGSRGPVQGEGIWPLYYLGPFSDKVGVMLWADQWLLNGWQNISFTVALLLWTFYVTWRWNRSPFSGWAPKVHKALVDTLRTRFGRPK